MKMRLEGNFMKEASFQTTLQELPKWGHDESSFLNTGERWSNECIFLIRYRRSEVVGSL